MCQKGKYLLSCSIFSVLKSETSEDSWNPQELSEDDVAFWSYVKPDQRPATVAGDSENNYVDEENEEADSEEDMMEID